LPAAPRARFDERVLVPLVPSARMLDAARLHLPGAAVAGAWARHAVRYLSQHTGVPALLVAAVLVAVGYRLLKRSFRFLMEVTLVAAALVAMTELGWIQW
jgi:hypothetical protein